MSAKAAVVSVQRRRRPKRAVAPEAAEREGAQYHLKAIARALDVLDCFTDERPELTLKDIAHALEVPESSLFRILLTLDSRRYLVQNSDGAYRLAPKLLLGRVHERSERVRTVLHPYLDLLASRFDETAASAYLFDDRVHVLDAVESFHAIRMTNKPGRVLPPHASSLGKSIIAFQKPALIERMLEVYGLVRRTERTVTDRQALLAEFERIRAQGYAADREESVLGGVCVGAAVTVDGAPVMAAISVSTPVVRMTPERELEITRAVLDAARQAAIELKKQ
jgi:DNA-binding IclR family transcriptional regulator